MELLVMAAVAAVGYELGKRSDAKEALEARKKKYGRYGKRDGGSAPGIPGGTDGQAPVATMLAMDAEINRRHFEAAGDPRKTGVFDPVSGPNMVSLPRGRYPMRAAASDRESFEGTEDTPGSQTGVWKHKVESEPRFEPGQSAARVSFNGSAGNPYSRGRDPTVSGTSNNIAPTTKLNVGRGVGYGPDVPAADGFHPYFRTMPGNTGVYRKNNLPGNVVPGKAPVDERTMPFYVQETYVPPKFYDLKRRPMGPNMARVTAMREIPKEPREVCKGHDLSEEYFGNPYGVNGVDSSGADSGDNSYSTRVTNERTQRSGTSAIGPRRTVMGPGQGVADVHMDEGRYEKLHEYETDRLGGPVETYVKGGAGTVGMVAPEVTLREITVARPYGHFLGIAGPTGHFVQQGSQNQSASKQLERHAKRGDQLVENWVPIGKFKTADELTFGAAGIKGHEIGGRVMSHPQVGIASAMAVAKGQRGGGARSIPNPKLMGAVQDLKTKSSRVAVENPRVLDLDIAANQLTDNPYNNEVGKVKVSVGAGGDY